MQRARLALPRIEALAPIGHTMHVRVACGFARRARGLLFAPPLRDDESLLLAPCNSVHTIGMRYAIDVVFLDRGARVLRVVRELMPWRACAQRGAAGVLELAAGAAARWGLHSGTAVAALEPLLAGGPHGQLRQD